MCNNKGSTAGGPSVKFVFKPVLVDSEGRKEGSEAAVVSEARRTRSPWIAVRTSRRRHRSAGVHSSEVTVYRGSCPPLMTLDANVPWREGLVYRFSFFTSCFKEAKDVLFCFLQPLPYLFLCAYKSIEYISRSVFLVDPMPCVRHALLPLCLLPVFLLLLPSLPLLSHISLQSSLLTHTITPRRLASYLPVRRRTD